MDGFAFDVGVERCAAVVAEFEREALVVHDDFLDTAFAQQGFDLAGDLGVFILRTQQGPDDAVVLLGKGHEKTIERIDGEYPWNETEVTRAALKALLKTKKPKSK